MTDQRGPAWRRDNDPAEIVASDGTRVRCYARAVPCGTMVPAGGGAKESKIMRDFEVNGAHRLGPVADPDTTMEQLQELVERSWRERSPK